MRWVNAFEERPIVDNPHPVAGSCTTLTNREFALGDEWDRGSRVIGGWVGIQRKRCSCRVGKGFAYQVVPIRRR
jgi:hypothetical protein